MPEYGFSIEVEPDAEQSLIDHLLQFNFKMTCGKHPELLDYEPQIKPGPNNTWFWYVDTEEQEKIVHA